MKPLLIALFILTALPGASQAVSPPVSREAKECFEWFETLGYPDTTHARWAEIRTGGMIQYAGEDMRPNTVLGFVLQDDGVQCKVLFPDLLTATLASKQTATKECIYQVRPFHEYARRYLTERHEPYWDRVAISMRRRWMLEKKARVFFLAHVAFKRGQTEMAQALFDEAARLPSPDATSDSPNASSMRRDLERELGKAALFRVILDLAGGDDEVLSGNNPLQPRNELISALKQMARDYPASDHVDEARSLCTRLERMNAEEAGRPWPTTAEMRKLPIDDQVREHIFRLRFQNKDSYQPENLPPTGPDDGLPPEKSLIALGIHAVPLLIESLGDPTPTRTLYFGQRHPFTYTIMTVGDLCESVIRNLSLTDFTDADKRMLFIEEPARIEMVRRNALSWWVEFQKKGEEAMLVEAISSGTRPSGAQIARLTKINPLAVDRAILVGALKAEAAGRASDYLGEVGQISSDDATRFLLRQMEQDTNRYLRVDAIRTLWNRGHPAALPTAIKLWQALPLRLKPSHNDEFDALLRILAATKDQQALALILDQWDQRPANRRLRIIDVLRDKYRASLSGKADDGMIIKQAPREVHQTVIRFLVDALDDTDGSAGYRGSTMQYTHTNPRVCDFALMALHEIAPEEYAYANRSDRSHRDRAILQAKNHWRRSQGQPEPATPEASPPLPTEKAMQISQVNCHFGDHPDLKSLQKHVLSWKGRNFTPDLLVEIALDYAGSSAVKTSNLSVEAVRSRDLSGVALNLQLRPSMPLIGTELQRVFSIEVDGRGTLMDDNSVALGNAVDREYWTRFEEHFQKVVTAAPEADFVLRICLGPMESDL
ncbi:hypothetical protein [Verrucomicrobium sp. BvORR106]|uniref:hypothetical protein n=1 Tax=Verrucomicrobium sp. BvORR106 TaxID=1403819 RepID=UPI0005711A1A|nr:hypothetical protein [Verrucomicrobium sp. BvORR106]